jgi:hypothetical protein
MRVLQLLSLALKYDLDDLCKRVPDFYVVFVAKTWGSQGDC